ncbi:MAG TPA: hypothetical protein PLD00_04345 [Methanofastidiosum sp.]|jgi:hypothetical protein|nr:MAG: hypothetical protein BWX72_00116 [Firmicutes bacterium ADurb.Bin080]HPX24476.1 hypothetical protein [Methanofastidiosum sp.]
MEGLIETAQDALGCSREMAILILIITAPILLPLFVIVVLIPSIPFLLAIFILNLFAPKKEGGN